MDKTVKKSYLWDYDKKVAIQYARVGECNICGLCCQGRISFTVVGILEKDNPESGGRGTSEEGQWVEVSPNGQKIYFKMKEYEPCDKQCKNLQEDGKCGAYGQRSTLCREWPFSPSNLTPFPDCSYKFIKVGQWTFKDIHNRKAEREKFHMTVSAQKNKNSPTIMEM
jgi:Fe-S-cluster containining protein